jgi:hypothetical protein
MRIAAMEQLQQVRCEIKEEYLDFSESQLMEAVEKGEAWAICFHLKSAKARNAAGLSKWP